MPSKIYFQTWSGGSGCGDPKRLMGYCKEEPKEVLSKVYQTHLIYEYCDLYRPVDWSYPNNVEGLVIVPISEEELRKIGIIQTLSVYELDLSKASIKTVRTKETYEEAYQRAMESIDQKKAYVMGEDDSLGQSVKRDSVRIEEVREVTLGGENR